MSSAAGAWFEVTPESVARHIADRLSFDRVVPGLRLRFGDYRVAYRVSSSFRAAVFHAKAVLRLVVGRVYTGLLRNLGKGMIAGSKPKAQTLNPQATCHRGLKIAELISSLR